LRPAVLAAWASVPPLLVLVTPRLAVDLARQGPSEPLMVGGMAVGGVLAVFGLKRLLGGADGKSRAFGIATIVAGYVLWLFGVYQKEASICALALLIPLYFVLDRNWRAKGIIDRPLHRHWAFRIVAFALLLPLVHMLYEISAVTEGGETVYGASVPSGLSGWVTRLWDSADLQWSSAPELELSLWLAVAFAIPWLLLAWILRHKRIPWLALGVIATAIAVYLFQGLANVVVTRYFIPVAALVGVAAVLLLVDAPRVLRIAVIVGVIVFAVQAGDAKDLVNEWADYQEMRLEGVAAIAKLNPSRCPVYMQFMHAEDADAIPELVRLEPTPAGEGCERPYAAYMVRGGEAGQPVTNEAIAVACRTSWVPLKGPEAFTFYGCRRLATGEVEGQKVANILRWDRLVPGHRLSERIHSFPDSALCESPECMPQLVQLRETYR
jgi:hypothetical protein